MKKKGFTIIEIIVSVGLISIVMLLLFQLLTDMEYQEKYASFAKENQVNRATVIRSVQNDLMNHNLLSVSETSRNNSKEITFQFETFSRILIVFKDRISYNNEVWLLETGNDDAFFALDKITATITPNMCAYNLNIDVNGDGRCDYNCDTNNNGILDSSESGTLNATYRTCSAYKTARVKIPVVNNDEKDNNIDDIEFFYIGK